MTDTAAFPAPANLPPLPALPIPLPTLFQLLASAAGNPATGLATLTGHPELQPLLSLLFSGAVTIFTQINALGPQISAGNQTADPLRAFIQAELQTMAARLHLPPPPNAPAAG